MDERLLMIVLRFNYCSVVIVYRNTMSDEKPKELPNKNWTRVLIIAGLATTIGSSLNVGYNIGVVNAPAEIIKKFCNDTLHQRFEAVLTVTELDILWSSIVSIFLIGGAVGSLTGSWLADYIGRKGGIILSNVLGIVAGVFFFCSKYADSVEMLLLGRLLVGLSGGLATCIVPMYLTELAPVPLRGAMGVLCPLGVTAGVLFGQIMSLKQVLGTADEWHYLLAFYIILIVISCVAIPFLPESPKYLYVVKKQTDLALEQLVKIRNVSQVHLTRDIEELQDEKESAGLTGNWNIGKFITDKTFLLPLMITCSMQAGQQFSGINAVFYYSVSIFENAGLSEGDAQLATIGAGIINLAMAVIAIPVMSRFNRRIVYQISASTSCLFLIILGIAITYIETVDWMPYVSIVGVLGYVLCYGIGLGPIAYFIGSELFEVGPRPSAMALGSMSNWAGNFVIGMLFPTMQSNIGAASFYIFAGVTLYLFLFIRFYMPETRGKDPTEISQLCKDGFSSKPLNSPVHSSTTEDTLST